MSSVGFLRVNIILSGRPTPLKNVDPKNPTRKGWQIQMKKNQTSRSLGIMTTKSPTQLKSLQLEKVEKA